MPLNRDPHDDSRSNMQSLSAPSWTASSSYSTSPRRPFAISETPSSPASSTASQKFEVKRLLSRPADPASCSRPLTLVSTTPSAASDLQPTIKRSNSLGKGFLKRRPSRSQDDAATPKARNVPLDDVPSMPSYVLQDPGTTPASAYARAYAQRTQMSLFDSHLPSSSADREPLPRARTKSRPRAPSESADRARVDTDETIIPSVPALALAGAGPASAPKKPEDSFGRGLTRKVSARFRRRKNSNPGGIMSDGEADMPIRSQSRRDTGKDKESRAIDWNEWEAGRQDWSREKERVGLRGIGVALASNNRSPVLSVAQSSSSSPRLADYDATMRAERKSRKRLSRHLSIEDFRGLMRVKESGATFEMWDPKTPQSGPQVGPEADKPSEMKRSNSTNRKERTRRDLAAVQEKQMAATIGRSGIKDIPMARTESQPPLFRKDDLYTIYKESSPTPSVKGEPSSKRSTMVRSDSMPSESPRPTGIASPESRKENKIWRLVKKMSTGTLKEKRSYQAEKAPPVPPLPNSRRSSVHDYGEEIRGDLARGSSRPSISREPGSATGSIHSGPSSLSGHVTGNTTPQAQPQPLRHRSASGGRPSLSHEWRPSMTNDSAPSSSPKSSFGKPQSPRTSMSSYVDISEDVPPLPLGKHIVPPMELAQQYTPREREPLSTNNNNTGVGATPSLPPPKRPRAAQKSRDKASNITPLSSPALSNPQSTKSKPNVLRRPTRLNDDGLTIPARSPRPASTASPRSPRSASMGMPSPRPRAQTQSQVQLPPRPRSNSLGTVFTFRELGNTETRSKLTEQEKVAKFEQLLEASEKAGGTLHARLHDRALLSDTMRMSGNFDGASVVSEL
ncbi:unnamed protein product [Rhizoctonia solani]|uniref:Uncharacterized protein n=1 Tax=Rhizoctonia solani TaxID=456999 RepID=A0A8H3ASZ7_9AGAM|nr:unnamed protein product [Rhizoctonia solani]